MSKKYKVSMYTITMLQLLTVIYRKEWVRSSKPHPIGLSLRRIKGIIRRDQPLDIDCFNMAIRILACDKALLPVDPPVRFMDLQFCVSYPRSQTILILSPSCLLTIFYLDVRDRGRPCFRTRFRFAGTARYSGASIVAP